MADDIPTEIMPVQQCGAVLALSTDPERVSRLSHSSFAPSEKWIAEAALRKLDEAWSKDQETHAANLAAIENNKALRIRVGSLMDAIGMPVKYTRPKPGSRSWPPKRETVEAGYLTDIKREIPIDDGFEKATAGAIERRTRFQKFLDDALAEHDLAQQAAAQAEERRRAALRANVELAQIVIRHGLPPETDWNEALEALRPKDQRLDLAAAMYLTRGDWSEGAYRVGDALRRFKIEDDTDKNIATDVVSHMEDFEDGRVFRDCEWNYGRLFAEARDPQLAADIQACLDRADA